MKISGTYAICPEGSDPYAVVLRDGRVVSMTPRHLGDTFEAAHDVRSAMVDAIEVASKVSAATAGEVLTAVGDWAGEDLDPTMHVVGRI